MKYIIKKVNTIKDYERTCSHEFNSIDDLSALRDYYNEISIYNSDDIENERHCNLLVELCDYLEMLNNDREIKDFQKLTDILFETLDNDKRHLSKDSYNKLFELLYYVYKMHFCISEMLNDYNINDIFRD